MKLTTLTAILVISLFSVSAFGVGDSTYLEERSARLHQELSQPQGQQTMETERLQNRENRRFLLDEERWWR